AVLNVWIVWALHKRPTQLQYLMQWKASQQYLHAVCLLAGEQVPADQLLQSTCQALRLHEPGDFARAARDTQQLVFGHDATLTTIFDSVRAHIELRRAQSSAHASGPLASFLLVGNPGIGKCYLTHLVARLLYSSGRVFHVNCDASATVRLTAASGAESELASSLRHEPFQLILLENIQRLPVELFDVVRSLLQHGASTGDVGRRPVSVRGAVVVLTLDCAASPRISQRAPKRDRAEDHRDLCQLLADEFSLPHELTQAITNIITCPPLDDLSKSRIVERALQDECAAHDIKLTACDKELIAAEILRLTPERGMSDLHANVKRLLREPILAALRDGQKKLALRIHNASS
ncbi:MAG: hypothetical protein KDB23_26765, partial [Planctomycetales bacterium]|nr:hypothetical protein [Planctomycetales bacterium]